MLAAAVLASGCCCPPLSGRYEQPTGPVHLQHANEAPPAAAKLPDPPPDHRHRPHLGHRFGWHGLGHGPETPPGQHVPSPRFHPVPVRPVFEPQYDYSLQLPHGLNLAPIVTPDSLGPPIPAQPVPDPA
jgi:hypothetical protein